jgi:hypothetical protein
MKDEAVGADCGQKNFKYRSGAGDFLFLIALAFHWRE